jgi:hypothetical protein
MTRRRLLLGTAASALMAGCRGTLAVAGAPLTPEDIRYRESNERMFRKFGRPGFVFVVDAMEGQKFLGVEFFAEHAGREFYGINEQPPQTRIMIPISSPPPERVRIVWRDSSVLKFMTDLGMRYAGNIVGNEILEVGTRVPQELIDDLKREPGSLRLKFRMSDQGTLFGWDIQRRPEFDPKGRDLHGEAAYAALVHSFAGGDFREAKILDGKPVRKGWYIDKRTGQTIETDF